MVYKGCNVCRVCRPHLTASSAACIDCEPPTAPATKAKVSGAAPQQSDRWEFKEGFRNLKK